MNRQLIFLVVYCLSLALCGPTEMEADPDDKIIEPEDGFRGATTPAPLAFLEIWDEWETWEPPEKIAKLAPYYKSGYDYDGLPIITVQFGKWNYRELAHLKPDEMNDFLKHFEQYIRRAETEGAANEKAGFIYICDWDGFSLKHYASSKALELSLKCFTSMSRISDPIHHGFMINTNFAAETFLNTARPFLGNMMEKIEIYGGRREKWKPALLRIIPSTQLPPEYGGDKDWKPVPWIKKEN